jgi:hypothetical protein
MPSKTIPNATIADVETALVEQYGRAYTDELTRSSSHAVWTFRAGAKLSGKCTINAVADGVAVSVLSYSPLWVKVLLTIMICAGLIAFIFPGLIMIAALVIRYFIISMVLKSRLSMLIETVGRIVAVRTKRDLQPI